VMSQDALNQMRDLVRAAVRQAQGDMSDVLTTLAARLEPQVWLTVGAIPDLAALGTTSRSLDHGRLNWARSVLKSILQALDELAVERIARGIVVLLDDEIRAHRERAKRREQRLRSPD